MKIKEPTIGGICQILQGRDKDRFYIISEISAEGAVMVVDGNFKKFCSPKKKNLRHLRLLPEKAEAIAAKLAEGAKVYDSEVYSALKDYNYPKPAESGEENK